MKTFYKANKKTHQIFFWLLNEINFYEAVAIVCCGVTGGV